MARRSSERAERRGQGQARPCASGRASIPAVDRTDVLAPVRGSRRLSVRSEHLHLAAGILGVGIAYWSLAKLGTTLYYDGGVEVVWLPAGFTAAVLYLGDMRWAAGAAAADLLLGTGVVPFHLQALLHDPTVFYQTVGNTIEFVLAAYLMRRWLGPRCQFERPVDIARLVLIFLLVTPISATLGTLSSWQGGYISASQMPTFFRTWILADASGAILIVPLMLVWWPLPRWRDVEARTVAEALAIIGLVGISGLAAFSSHHPLTYLAFPALVLAAVTLGQRGATVALALTFAMAMVMTTRDIGPFVTGSITDEVLNTQLFMIVATVGTLTLGAAVNARRRAAVELAEARRREAEVAAEERQRIARDLHDSVSQTLFSLSLHAGLAKHELARVSLPDGSALPAAIDEVETLAQGALLEMRASIFALRGAAVAEQGLVAALAAHATALAARHGVAVTVDGPDERLPLTPRTEELLGRIGQEAITNAVKHSGSPTVSVEVGSRNGHVTMNVADRGTGFDAEGTYPGHLGLDLIRTRALDAGGSATIASAPDAGTTVRVVVPAAPSHAAPRAPLGRLAAPPASAS